MPTGTVNVWQSNDPQIDVWHASFWYSLRLGFLPLRASIFEGMAWAFSKAAASTLCFLSTSESYVTSKFANKTNSCPSKAREASSVEMPAISIMTVVPSSGVKLHMLSGKVQSTVLASDECVSDKRESISQQPKALVKEAMTTKILFESEEAGIAAAAAQAITLAKAAVKAAKDASAAKHAAAAWAEDQTLAESEEFPSEADLLRLGRARLTEMEKHGAMKTVGESKPSGRDLEAKCGSDSATCFNFCSEREIATSSKKEPNIIWVSQKTVKVTARYRRRLKSKARKTKLSDKTTKAGTRLMSVQRVQKAKKTVASVVDFSDPLRLFRQTASSRFLTDREEAEFSQRIQDVLKLERIRARIEEKIGQEPTSAQWAEAVGLDQRDLERKLLMAQHCRDEIVNRCLRLVISVAKLYQGRGISLQDLIQEGSIGLLRGAERFDYKRGFKFSTYVHWWISQAVRRAVAKQSRIIRLPVYVYETLSRIREAKRLLYEELGRYPRHEEVADLLGLSTSRVKFVLKCSRFPISMDQHIGRDDQRTLKELIADPDVEGPETTVNRQLLRQDIDKALENLRPREKEVLRLRFGLKDGMVKSRDEIGHLFCVSGERIRQIEINALRKLKQDHINKDLRHYLDF